jgi:thiol-disulfide isomerase/thioredoxin
MRMTPTSIILSLLLLAWSVVPAGAVDLKKLDRTILKEPKYTSEPRYALLVFGPEAKTKVWLVLDGETLYVDRNGNGDLTENGERVPLAGVEKIPPGQRVKAFHRFDLGKLHGIELLLEVWVPEPGFTTKDPVYKKFLDERTKYGLWTATLTRGAADGSSIGSPLVLARRPQDAQICHLGGPLTFHLLEDQSLAGRQPLKRGAGGAVLHVSLGTPGLPARGNRQPTYAPVGIGEVPAGVHPVAELEFANKVKDGPPLRLHVPLDERCCGDLFYATVRVPAGAAGDKAKLTLSFPDWKVGNVAPATFDVPVEHGPAEGRPAQGLPVGNRAPNIEAEGLDGKRLKLSDSRGKVTAVVFWATWCPPCMKMVAHEKKLVERLKDKPFVLVGVNGDADRDHARLAAEKAGMTWRSFWSGNGGRFGGIVEEWNVREWPAIYVLDARGVVRWMSVGCDGLDEVLDKLLEELAGKK